MCTHMLGHCLEKEHWLENMESWHLKKEIWHGGFGTQKVFGLCFKLGWNINYNF